MSDAGREWVQAISWFLRRLEGGDGFCLRSSWSFVGSEESVVVIVVSDGLMWGRGEWYELLILVEWWGSDG